MLKKKYKKKYNKEYNTEYYQKNKERINETKKIKVFCECGCELQKGNFAKHIESYKHFLWRRLRDFIYS